MTVQVQPTEFRAQDTYHERAQKLNQLSNDLVSAIQALNEVLESYREIAVLEDADATPDVLGRKVLITANTGGTTITGFDNGVIGQTVLLFIGDGNTTIDFTGTTLTGNGGVDWTPGDGDHMRATFDGTNWRCEVFENS